MQATVPGRSRRLQGTGALGSVRPNPNSNKQQAKLRCAIQKFELARIAYQSDPHICWYRWRIWLRPWAARPQVCSRHGTVNRAGYPSYWVRYRWRWLAGAQELGAFRGRWYYGQMANASGLALGTGGMRFPMFGSRGGAAYAKAGKIDYGLSANSSQYIHRIAFTTHGRGGRGWIGCRVSLFSED